MRSRRRVLVAASGAAALFAIGAACTFPSVDFAAAADSGSDTDTGGHDLDAAVDAPLIEAATYDADSKVDAAGCMKCDCDEDNYFSRGGDAGCDGGPGAVYDCDDTDSFINPSQDFVEGFTWPSTVYSKVFDWNCSGVVEKAYATGLTCSFTLSLPAVCVGGEGFKGDPACGTSEDYFACKASGFNCTAVKIDTRVQSCK